MPLVLPILCPYAGEAELASILVKLRSQKTMSEIIKCVESVCQPLFIITPYQLSSRDTMIVVTSREHAAAACKELRKCPNVIDAQVFEELPVEIVFPLKTGNVRGVLFSEGTLKAIFAEAYNYMQPSIVKTMLFHIGFTGGISIAQHLLAESPGKDHYEVIRHYLTTCFPVWGDGLPQDIARKGETYLLVVKDLVECKLQAQLNLRYGSHFYRGLFSGLFTGALGKEYTAIEKTCLTRGDRYCTFILAPKTEAQKGEY